MPATAITTQRTGSDDPRFTKLVAELDKDLYARYGEQQSFFDRFNKLDHIRRVVLAMVDGEPVGCGAVKEMDASTGEIKRMYVRSAFRSNGIGLEILKELEAWSRETGWTACVLETARKQPEAIRLYEKAGYHVTENYGQYIGVELSVCMMKSLTGDK